MARGDKKREDGAEKVTGDSEKDAAANRERTAKGRSESEVNRAQHGKDSMRSKDEGDADRLAQKKFGAPTWRDAIEADKKKEEKGKGKG